MDGSSVFLVALFTSVVTAAGTVYVIERTGIIAPRAEAVPETVVPDFRGASESDARANAAAAHIALLIAAREPSPEAKPGTVVRQSAPAGQRVPREYSMSVVLAEEVPRVPGVAGLNATDARQRLEQAGYHAQDGVDASAAVEKGLVIEQSPKADTALAKGGTVRLTVSSGPDEVEVPKLIGVGIAQAQANLEKLSLKAVVRWISQGETPAYVVLSQKPAAAAKVN